MKQRINQLRFLCFLIPLLHCSAVAMEARTKEEVHIREAIKLTNDQLLTKSALLNAAYCPPNSSGQSEAFNLQIPLEHKTWVSLSSIESRRKSISVQLKFRFMELSGFPSKLSKTALAENSLDETQENSALTAIATLSAQQSILQLALKETIREKFSEALIKNLNQQFPKQYQNHKVTINFTEGNNDVNTRIDAFNCANQKLSFELVDAAELVFARGLNSSSSNNSSSTRKLLKNAENEVIAYSFQSEKEAQGLAVVELQSERSAREKAAAIEKDSKIVGGELVDASIDTSWLVALAKRLPNGRYAQFCAGTLIDERLVISAAHCNITNSHFAIIGRKTINGEGGLVIPIKDIWRHKDYAFKARYDSDIAIIELAVPESNGLKEHVIPITKTPPNQPKRVRVMGWGAKLYRGQGGEELFFVDLDILNSAACRYPYSRTKLKVTESMFCAAAPNKDSCQGDSGGGAYFMDRASGSVELAGLVSYGIGCGNSRFPGVYTNVYRFRDWINQVSVALLNRS